MAEKKDQHLVPKCYLKAWCDPVTPAGQTPFIWLMSKDGKNIRKKSPKKSFRESDRYTIHLSDGTRNLTVENSLGQIENDFTNVLNRIRNRDILTPRDRAHLCSFAAAMHTRSKAMGNHWQDQMRNFHNQVVEMEKAYELEPVTSIETAEIADRAIADLVTNGIKTQVPILFAMPMTILTTNDDYGFITSDTPCVWFNPEWYKLPPFYRSPGLMMREIEVTLPLTPRHTLFISHHQMKGQYTAASGQVLNDINRRTRFHCLEEFVTWKGKSRSEWFDEGVEPNDSWEKNMQAKEAIEQAGGTSADSESNT